MTKSEQLQEDKIVELVKAGLIQYRMAPAKANGGEKKYYYLTEEGKNTLKKMKNFWEIYKESVDAFLKEEENHE